MFFLLSPSFRLLDYNLFTIPFQSQTIYPVSLRCSVRSSLCALCMGQPSNGSIALGSFSTFIFLLMQLPVATTISLSTYFSFEKVHARKYCVTVCCCCVLVSHVYYWYLMYKIYARKLTCSFAFTIVAAARSLLAAVAFLSLSILRFPCTSFLHFFNSSIS